MEYELNVYIQLPERKVQTFVEYKHQKDFSSSSLMV